MPENHIIRIEPVSGRSIKEGRQVKVFVSKGKQEIKVPTLVILGENDLNYFQMTSNVLRIGITKSVLKTVTDSGHMVNMEQPDEFNKILLDFLANQKSI